MQFLFSFEQTVFQTIQAPGPRMINPNPVRYWSKLVEVSKFSKKEKINTRNASGVTVFWFTHCLKMGSTGVNLHPQIDQAYDKADKKVDSYTLNKR